MKSGNPAEVNRHLQMWVLFLCVKKRWWGCNG
nr:MAG TPA: hypothetical protein [Caudoviricetes sp.]